MSHVLVARELELDRRAGRAWHVDIDAPPHVVEAHVALRRLPVLQDKEAGAKKTKMTTMTMIGILIMLTTKNRALHVVNHLHVTDTMILS